MDTIFYLDDYNLISSNVNELISISALYKNGKELDFNIAFEDKLKITFFDEYKKGDRYVVLYQGETYLVKKRLICQSEKFDNYYKVDLSKLGSFYSKTSTSFRVWAPLSEGAYVVVNDEEYRMSYLGKGLYEAVIKGDLEKARYHFDVIRDGETISFKDIFAYSNVYNKDESYVIDLKKINFKKFIPKPCLDPIIYELSIRDFSSDLNAPFKCKGKFLSFLEKGLTLNDKKIGIDYIKELGVTHIQLMPVLNFDYAHNDYNWGYNPIDYNSFNWKYVVDEDPYSPIAEFRCLVDELHKNNLRVNLDVVYNHVYKIEDSVFTKILPYYFFRYEKDGRKGDASWCGNELRTESYFLREYLNLINKRLVNIYDIDGLRFDLAGVLDVDSINYFVSSLREIKSDFMMYGEGWHMGDIVPDDKKASILNSDKMPGFAFFNGSFRDSLTGDYNNPDNRGYLFFNRSLEENAKKSFSSTWENFNYNNSINYIECHDNYTFYDRIEHLKYDENLSKNIAKLGLASVVLSRGIPFIHAGQEFLTTKKQNGNSYNAGDEINKIDWNLVNENSDVVEYFKMLIDFRKKHPIFNKEIEYSFSYYYDLLIMSIDNIDIFINPTEYPYVYDNWITYKDIYYPNTSILHDQKAFDIPDYSIVFAEKI